MNQTIPKVNKQSFPVTGMTCAGCASSVESILSHTEGVKQASVNFASNSVWVEYEEVASPESLQKSLQAVGFDLIINTEDPLAKQQEVQEAQYKQAKINTLWAAILTFPIFIIGMFFMEWEPGKWLSLILAIPVLFYFGRNFFTNAWKQAKHGKANMDTLVALSTSIAFTFSLFNTLFPEFWHSKGLEAHVYYEAATVIITFICLGKLLEEKAKSNTSTALKKLIGLQPQTLHLLVNGVTQEVAIDEVQKGAHILVKPGEKIPVDGQIISGSSYIDESMITGEHIASEKQIGDIVFSGTINQKGSFQMEATKVGKETLLAQIIQRVQEAQGSKAPIQQLADKIASVFVPAVMGIALLTFTVWMLLGGTHAFTHALLTSVAVLVIACPCALGLATPTAIMVGIGKGASNNILIKNAESLELAHRIQAIILDKTGTITQGKPSVTDIYWGTENTHHQQTLLALESSSEHPLARAVVQKLAETGVQPRPITHFNSITGRGIEARDEQGSRFMIGNAQLLQEKNISLTEEEAQKAKVWQEEAKTVVYFANEQELLAIIAIADQVKTSSAGAIQQLQAQGIEAYMLTGDNPQTAKAVAAQVGISHFKGEQLPNDKAAFVKELQASGKMVAMIGDGINDSEALAQADVSIAMGHGSDIAMDVAQITLMTSDLAAVPKALRLSSRTVKGIRQNLFWAFVYNIIGIPIAAGLLYPINGFLLDPMIAGGAMALSSVSVVLNSLRLKLGEL